MWLLLTEKHLCWSLFLILSISKFLRAPILKSIFKQLLLKINYLLRKKRFFEHQYQKQVKMYAIISWLVSHEVCIHLHTIFLWHGKKWTLNTKYLLEFSENYISQWEFDYGLFTNLPRIIVSHYFSPSSFKVRRDILPLLTKYVS